MKQEFNNILDGAYHSTYIICLPFYMKRSLVEVSEIEPWLIVIQMKTKVRATV